MNSRKQQEDENNKAGQEDHVMDGSSEGAEPVLEGRQDVAASMGSVTE